MLMRRRLVALAAAIAASSLAATSASGQCSGGTRGSNGLIPVLSVSRPVAGEDVLISVSNLASESTAVFVGYSLQGACRDVSATYGTGAWLWPSLTESPGGRPPFTPAIRLGAVSSVVTVTRRVPARWAGRHLYVQAFVSDPGAAAGYAFSGGSRLFIRDAGSGEAARDERLGGFLTLPSPQSSLGGVRDPRTGHVFLFGEEIVEVSPDAPFADRIRTTLDRFPTPRTSVAAFWDHSRNVAVLAGGLETATRTRLEDVFEFDPSRPEGERLLVSADRLPSGLSSATPVTIREAGLVLLFGGLSGSGYAVRQVLQYDTNRPAGSRLVVLPDLIPMGVSSIAGSYEPTLGSVLLFGLGSENIYEFDLRRAPGSRFSVFDTLLPARSACCAARDDSTGRIYLFGGWTGSSFISHVVEFDPSAPAGSRSKLVNYMKEGVAFGSALYDPDRQVIYTFGGSNRDGAYDQVLEFDAPDEVRPIGGFPEDMIGAPAVHASTTGKTYVFGAVTYEIDMNAAFGSEVRATIDAFPTVRLASAVAWDPGRGVAYLFGGRNPQNGQRVADVYEFDPSAPEGSRLSLLPDSLPGGQSNGAAVTSPRSGVVYLFGGTDASSRSVRSILRFDPSQPPGSRLATLPDTLPVAASTLTAIWDEGANTAYLLGDGTNWIHSFDPGAADGTRLKLAGQLPSERTGVAAAFDSSSGVIYLVGGWTSRRTFLNDVLRFDPSAREDRRVTIVDVLGRPRAFAAAVYDRFRGDVLVIAGDESGNDIRWIRTLR